MMRFTTKSVFFCLVALAGCASPPNPAASTAPVVADAQESAVPAPKRAMNCIVGTKICTKDKQVDPSVQGIDGDALGDATRGHPGGYHELPK